MVKHWFRNTLFKERQRNKDSPYNFNNPPSTTLNLEEYERTGQAKVTALNSELANNSVQSMNFQQNSSNNGSQNDSRPHSQPSSIASTDRSDYPQNIKSEPSDETVSSGLMMDDSPFHHHSLAMAAAAAVAAQQRNLHGMYACACDAGIFHSFPTSIVFIFSKFVFFSLFRFCFCLFVRLRGLPLFAILYSISEMMQRNNKINTIKKTPLTTITKAC